MAALPFPQALRAGLAVSQAKLEGQGLVFASGVAHQSAAQAWAATGPLSMARQVVAAVNQQLTVGGWVQFLCAGLLGGC